MPSSAGSSSGRFAPRDARVAPTAPFLSVLVGPGVSTVNRPALRDAAAAHTGVMVLLGSRVGGSRRASQPTCRLPQNAVASQALD